MSREAVFAYRHFPWPTPVAVIAGERGDDHLSFRPFVPSASLGSLRGRPTGRGRTRRPSAVSSFARKRSLPNGRPVCVRRLTADNGREFARPLELEKKLDLAVYFAHPYHAWERGTNENTNGLLRQYLPKGTDLSQVTPEQLSRDVRQLNRRPRQCLAFRSPFEVFHAPPPE